MSTARKYETKRHRLEIVRGQLIQERESFIPVWKECGEYLLTRRGRFDKSDVNRGDRRNRNIIDATGTYAVRTLRSGMMSGITSPARPWFRLSTPDPTVAEVSAVKRWLHLTGERMQTVFLRSNIYQILPILYGDIGVFGTGAVLIEEDDETVFRAYPLPVGSYCISVNEQLKVDTIFRDFKMTVRQIVQKYGNRDAKGNIDWSNISTFVKNQYDQGHMETWVEVVHGILPNEDYKPGNPFSKFKKYKSCVYEAGRSSGSTSSYGNGADEDVYLSEKGYEYFPVLCPRWEITGEDAYATEYPGVLVIGDVKQLQHGERRAAQAIDKKVMPPMTAPTSMENVRVSILPGDVTYIPVGEEKGFRPAHEVNLSTVELENKQEQIRRRIKIGLFEDLFRMLGNDTRSNITAREIDERVEEKLLVLGPVLEQLNQDLLDPLIDIIFMLMERKGILPEVPDELAGVPLKVEYTSIMAQAQKSVDIGGHSRFLELASAVLNLNPNSRDKIDFDQYIDVMADRTSVNPTIIRSDDDVSKMREAQAKAQRAQQLAQSAPQAASVVKTLSETNMEGDNALNRMVQAANAGSLVPGGE